MFFDSWIQCGSRSHPRLSRFGPFAAGVLTLWFSLPAIATAGPPHLWTVQAINAGTELVCDAFAAGAAGRPLYEFRFRRSRAALLLILPYEGPKLHSPTATATITIGDASNTFPAKEGHFGKRNAFLISLDPASVDFRAFDQTMPFRIEIGPMSFGLATLADDHLSENYNACLQALHLD